MQGCAYVDGVVVGGRPAGEFGPVTKQLQQAYWALHDDPRFTEAVSTA